MNFDHWKDVLNEETPAPDFYRAYVESVTDPRKRKRVGRSSKVGVTGFIAPTSDLSARSPSPRPSPSGRGRDASRNGPVRARSSGKTLPQLLPLPEGEGRGEGEGWLQPAGTAGDTTRPAVLIPKAPGYSATPVTEPADAFIPPQRSVFVRVQAQGELA